MLRSYVDPGQQTFWSMIKSTDAVTLDVLAGKTYYIKATKKVNIPKLTVVSESEAKTAISDGDLDLKQNTYNY